MILDARPPRQIPVFEAPPPADRAQPPRLRDASAHPARQAPPPADRAQPPRLRDASAHPGRRARDPLAGLTAKKIFLESY